MRVSILLNVHPKLFLLEYQVILNNKLAIVIVFYGYLRFVSFFDSKVLPLFNNKNIKLRQNSPESKFNERLLVLSQREKLFELAWNLLDGIQDLYLRCSCSSSFVSFKIIDAYIRICITYNINSS